MPSIPEKNERPQTSQFILFLLGNQKFALTVSKLKDVISLSKITPIPLAPKQIMGTINLRGRVVTIFDIEKILNFHNPETKNMMISIIEHEDHLYGFLVSKVLSVIELENDEINTTPGNVSQTWTSISKGICEREGDLIVIIDIDAFLNIAINS